MPGDFTFRRRLILAVLALLLVADVGLITYTLRNSSGSTAPQQRLAQETERLKLLKADVERAQRIRSEMPTVQADCDRFEQSMAPSSAGYSTVVAELAEIARKAGVRIGGVSFRETEIQNKPFSQIAIEATVDGPYTNVVRFLNGLQTSKA